MMDDMLQSLNLENRIDIAKQYVDAIVDLLGRKALVTEIPILGRNPVYIDLLLSGHAPKEVTTAVVHYIFQTFEDAWIDAERCYRDMLIQLYRENSLCDHNELMSNAQLAGIELPSQLTDDYYLFSSGDVTHAFFNHLDEVFLMIIERMDARILKDLWVHDVLVEHDAAIMPVLGIRIYDEIACHFGLSLSDEHRFTFRYAKPVLAT